MDKFQKVTAWLEIGGYQVAGWLISFFFPIAGFIAGMTVFVILDQFTGIRAARERGEEINSKGMRRTVSKILLYTSSIIGSHLMWYLFLRGSPFDLQLVYGTALQICATELVSINENVKSATGTGISMKILDPLINRFRKPKD